MRACLPFAFLAVAIAAPPVEAGEAWLAATQTRLSGADFEAGAGGELEAVEYRLSAGTPVGERFGTGLDYTYTRYEYEGVDGRNRDLHRLELPLSYGLDGEAWNVRFVAAPGISASSNVFKRPFERWTRDEVTLRAAIEGRRAWREHWDLVLGLRWDRRFGGQDAYPVVGLRYELGGTTLRLALPDSRLSIAFDNGLAVTASVGPSGHRWHVVSDETGQHFDYRTRAWRGQLGLRLPLGAQLALELGGGYETGRRHVLTDDVGNRLHADAAGQWLVTAGLRWGGGPGS